MRRALSCLLAGLLVTVPSGTSAIERKPLPVFALVARDGSDVSSTDLARDGKWLLIYVRPGCEPCDTLLNTIDPQQQPETARHLVVVIGGVRPATADALASGFADLRGAVWYSDATDTMRAALSIGSAPVVFGMRRNIVEWSLTGVVPNAASVKSALVSWVGTPR